MSIQDDFTEIVYKLRKALRDEVAESIVRVAKHLEITDDLLTDRRTTSWRPGGKAYKTVAERQTHKVAWRSKGEALVSLKEAADLCCTTRNAISRGINKTGVYTKVDADGDIITVTKLFT